MPAEKRKSARQHEPRKRFQEQTPSRETPSKKPTPLKKPSPEPPEEPLPTKIAVGKPLPLIRESYRLQERTLQSIAESGVVLASLERSRVKWLHGELLEKYWTKPTKKKGQPAEPPNNPAKETMTKLGQCRITIEPHILEATLYAVKPLPAPKVKPAPKQSTPLQAFAAGPPPPSSQIAYPNPPMAATPIFHQQQIPANIAAGKPAPTPVQPKPVSLPTAPAPAPVPISQKAKVPIPKPAPQTPKVQQPASAVSTPAPTALAPKGQDPVIQLLAQRASSNTELKALMKVVASGSATPDQLRVFQIHIDELTLINKSQEIAREAQAKKAAAAAAAAKASAQQPTFIQQPPPMAIAANPAFHGQHPTFVAHPPAPPIHYNYVTAPVKKPSPAPSKPAEVILDVVVEFAGGSGDRYLLPKASIFQYAPGGRQGVLSFLIVRKLEATTGTKSKTKNVEEVYQPVTWRIWTELPKVCEGIAKSRSPAEEVRRQMEEIMAKTKRAESGQLAIQLPRESDVTSEESRAATPVSLTKALDRRQSLLKTATLPSASGSATPTKKEKPNHFAETHCGYCFEAVPAPVQKLEGKTVCALCGDLRMNHLVRSGAVQGAYVATMRQISATQTLIF